MKKIIKRFLILFLCFSLLTGTYTKKANAIALVDDAFYVVAGVVVTGATIYALVDYTLSTGTSSYTADDVDKISTKLTTTQKMSTYLSVKAIEGGAKFLTWSKSGLDWLSDCIDTFNTPSTFKPSDVDTFLGSTRLTSYPFPSILGGFRQYAYPGAYANFNVELSNGKIKNINTPIVKESGLYDFGLTYSPNGYACSCFSNSDNYLFAPLSSISAMDNIVRVNISYFVPGTISEEEKITIKDYSVDNVNYNFFNPEPDENNDYKPKIGFPLHEFDKDSVPDYEPQINPDTGEEYNPFETPYTGDYAKENPDILVIPDGSTNPDPNPEPTPDPNPEPEPTPDPDPNPDTGNDEDKLPDDDTPVLDFSPLYGATRKFPFCLPWDIYECIKVFKSEEEPLKYEFKETKYSDTEIIIIPHFEIDFSKIPHINILRNVLKLFLYYQFIRFLMISIRKVMWS